MNKKITKMGAFLAVVAILTSVLWMPSTAEAYVLFPYYWKTPVNSLTYKWGSYLTTPGTVIRTGFENAISDWNSTPTPVYFYYDSNSSNVLNSEHINDDQEYGICYDYYTGSTLNYFHAFVNADNTHISENNVARGTAGHELGHGIGLDHSSSIALMNDNLAPFSIWTPQTDDINGVNARY